MKLILFDTESGGIGLDYSLLTAYFAIYDNDTLVSELDLKLKPDDGKYILSSQGMKVNKINFVEHDDVAIKYKEAKPLLYKFISEEFKGEKLVPLGQGIKGDINIVQNYLISSGSWDNFVSHNPIDTLVLAKFLQAIGYIPITVSLGLESLCDFFKIPKDSVNFHTAKYDVIMTWLLYQKIKSLFNEATK